MSNDEGKKAENEKLWFTAVRVPAVLLVGLVILAVVGYFITR